MDIVVCVKSVPETAEAELEVDDDGASIDSDDSVFGINEWDNYAVEEAVRLKEKHGGTVTVISLGDEESEDVLRRALAMGADEAIHLCDDAFDGSDSATVAKALALAIDGRPLDLVLTGVQSSDLGQGTTGPMLAAKLGLPHATLAVGIEVGEGVAVVRRELEANRVERVELPLPALVTVQSGINQPRYVSIMGIRKVRSKTIDAKASDDLGLEEEEVGGAAAVYTSRRLSMPVVGGEAEMLEGSIDAICTRAATILREKGGLQ